MDTLQAWIEHVCPALGIDPGTLDRDQVLDLTRDVAHNVDRPAAPLTAFLVGLVAGRSGGGRAEVQAACDAVRRAVAAWDAT